MQGRSILVPLDGSATAEAVLPWATTLARALTLPMQLLTVVQSAGIRTEQEATAAARAAQHYLSGVATALTSEGIATATKTTVTADDVHDAVSAAAGQVDAALITVATHGYAGFDRWMMGSVADALVRTASRPLLVIHADPALQAPEPHRFERIIVPLDGFGLAETALPAARDLTNAFGAVLDLVHVVPGPWAFVAGQFPTLENQLIEAAIVYLERVATGLPGELTAECHVRQGSAATAILDYADEAGPSLIVMSTNGRAGVSRWALGSVADRVVRAGYRPVLLIRPATEQIQSHSLFGAAGEVSLNRRSALEDRDVHPNAEEKAKV